MRKRVQIPRMGAATVGGRYRIERPLGHGGMATVYLGRDTELERPVAIKLLAENLAGDDEFRRRFVREAKLAARPATCSSVQRLSASALRATCFRRAAR